MIKLTIDNSECRIEGLAVELHKTLSNILCYTADPKTAYFSGGYVKKYSLLSKKGVFPTGLLARVKNYLNTAKLVYSIYDYRILPDAQKGLFSANLAFKPYPEQINAAKAAKKYERGIIAAPTGVGKSTICALIIQELQVPTLVVVPSLELKRQLMATLSEVFGTDKVGKGKPIYVQNIDETVTKFYDCVIIDEFHHSGAKTYRKLNKIAWQNTYYKFGLTATPFRSQDNENILLESVLADIIYKLDYETAVKNGYIVPMEAYYYELPKRKTNGITWKSVYSELVVNNDYRNSLVAKLIRSLRHNDISTLCLVTEINHGSLISKLSNVYFANGENEDTPYLIQLFNEDKLKSLIGTSGIVGEGIDTKPAEFIIIAGLGKSRNRFMQQCGRGFRRFNGKKSCKIILFLDKSHKWTREHFKTQCAILKEQYGITPYKLEL